ncbi:hypothetical protein AMAG_10047 [Allomyces macrogynus ATCC 38327]|uniref:GATA-type domain-containing protein n=1 Tax=Allomyces macrogynus (strain ATCC 38327) TaxID=578462 RepID=A0A0L0SQR0_ALLM3|nr:hypothetical protein AMAG_10047 [Allomyces macrogynus ATCC 38327]|eukprot:KNE64695.1 hypothetical protein AMAG_10047 [Allomyces macrogynus ATCC 38327]
MGLTQCNKALASSPTPPVPTSAAAPRASSAAGGRRAAADRAAARLAPPVTTSNADAVPSSDGDGDDDDDDGVGRRRKSGRRSARLQNQCVVCRTFSAAEVCTPCALGIPKGKARDVWRLEQQELQQQQQQKMHQSPITADPPALDEVPPEAGNAGERASSSLSSTALLPALSGSGSAPAPAALARRCAQCGVARTSSWRKGNGGNSIICNKCYCEARRHAARANMTSSESEDMYHAPSSGDNDGDRDGELPRRSPCQFRPASSSTTHISCADCGANLVVDQVAQNTRVMGLTQCNKCYHPVAPPSAQGARVVPRPRPSPRLLPRHAPRPRRVDAGPPRIAPPRDSRRP